MIVVIIAGGSGTRLWPLSTPDYPKHLLKINGDEQSLLQQTYARAKQIASDIYVVTDAGHLQHVKKQLPELGSDAFIVEPARRGTANCIVAALAHIAKAHDSDEPIAFLAADHFIRDTDGFEHSFRVAGEVTKKQGCIVLVGIEPDRPATGFGYIEKGKLLSEEPLVFNVTSFKEKPDYDTAMGYLHSGSYLWNAGYFVGSVDTFVRGMRHYAPELFANYQKLVEPKGDDYKKTYLSFDTISIDYALIEKVKGLLVVPAWFDWMDLGSYADLSKAAPADRNGNHVHGEKVELEEVQNSFIQNHEDKPIAVIGLDNAVVINTPHGILVTRKDLSQKVGDVSKRLTDKDK